MTSFDQVVQLARRSVAWWIGSWLVAVVLVCVVASGQWLHHEWQLYRAPAIDYSGPCADYGGSTGMARQTRDNELVPC